MASMKEERSTAYVYQTHITEVLMKSDSRYTCHKSQEAIKLGIDGLLDRKGSAFVSLNKIPQNSNILVGRIILAIKTRNINTKKALSFNSIKKEKKSSLSTLQKPSESKTLDAKLPSPPFTTSKYGTKRSTKHKSKLKISLVPSTSSLLHTLNYHRLLPETFKTSLWPTGIGRLMVP